MTEQDTGSVGARETACPSCGAGVPTGARFCESCGAQVGDAPAPAATLTPPTMVPADDLGDAPISAPTRRPAHALPDPPPDPGRRPCGNCGGEVGPDLYCLSCGTKAPSERDHFRETPASWVAGVCDKGVKKSRNEDAMALLAGEQPGSRAVLVVLDGVSNLVDSDVASLAGARAAREVLRTPLPAGMGTPQGRDAAVAKVFTDAAAAANTAIIAVTDPDEPNPASATFTVAVLEGTRISHANIGDSRCYWLPDEGEPVQLTVDDSVAQAQIASGVAKEVAETGEFAHAITKWLGRDSQDFVPVVGSLEVTGPGWLLACSDGLWNYASAPTALREQIQAATATDPEGIALELVAFANEAGGHDNITAALARVGPLPEAAPPPTPATTAATPTEPTEPAGAVPPPPPPVQNAGTPPAPPTTPTTEAAGEGAPTDG
ncbi:protein phosphatase 2C domain-containing protein [Nocardioides sp. HM23]|uniref:protein phosphatase 2C domain-containing protein n=1 Tax=Nocardioides bizhenqiangii TaxID=3095076 RepID=UPI002ACA52FE|nr:protein phosphatase 2C domain-containing protein [Nocardioides sp. HM23]MDZ5622993.1 protein phosphatase 2C domain-containing protein [Nocardioides sp. HM23]